MRLPTAVLEEIACNSKWTGMVYDARGALLWQGHTKRIATAAQPKARCWVSQSSSAVGSRRREAEFMQ